MRRKFEIPPVIESLFFFTQIRASIPLHQRWAVSYQVVPFVARRPSLHQLRQGLHHQLKAWWVPTTMGNSIIEVVLPAWELRLVWTVLFNSRASKVAAKVFNCNKLPQLNRCSPNLETNDRSNMSRKCVALPWPYYSCSLMLSIGLGFCEMKTLIMQSLQPRIKTSSSFE